MNKHNSGHASRYTRGRVPVRLVWAQSCGSYAEARALEAWLKGWSRRKKEQLIAGSLRLPFQERGRSG
jgi:putative endonuclease